MFAIYTKIINDNRNSDYSIGDRVVVVNGQHKGCIGVAEVKLNSTQVSGLSCPDGSHSLFVTVDSDSLEKAGEQ